MKRFLYLSADTVSDVRGSLNPFRRLINASHVDDRPIYLPRKGRGQLRHGRRAVKTKPAWSKG